MPIGGRLANVCQAKLAEIGQPEDSYLGPNDHKAAVEGDIVGDPFKETSGPSLNILLKLMAIASLVFAPVFLEVTPLIEKIT